jgi:energy-converting hydrogenase Eha subunit C
MSIDYTRLLSKLSPAQDGQDVARLRTGLVMVVNSDGTADVAISGVTIEDVPVLGDNTMLIVGQACQVLTYRGSLLVLGQSGSGAAGPVVTPSALFTFGTPTITNNNVQLLTPSVITRDDGNMYPGSGTDFTIPTGQGGSYEIGVIMRYSTQAAAVGVRQARINLNGAEYQVFNMPAPTNFNNFNITAAGVVRGELAAGDDVSFLGYQNAGVSLTLTTHSIGWIERKR